MEQETKKTNRYTTFVEKYIDTHCKDYTSREKTIVRNSVNIGQIMLGELIERYKNDLNINLQFYEGFWNIYVTRQDTYDSEVFSIGGYEKLEEGATELFSELERRFPKINNHEQRN